MNKAKVSILLPCHSHEQFIGASMQSALDQTYTDFELIVIDDASNDKSREIILSYPDKRIKRILLSENVGLCTALNMGLQAATGEYIARLDSDDIWEPNKLEKQMEVLENNPSLGACFTWAHFIDDYGNSHTEKSCDRIHIFDVENRSRDEWLRYFYFNGSCLCHPSVVIRNSVLKEIGNYNLLLKQLQDFELWIRIVKKYPIHVICEPLINYRWIVQGAQNTSAPNPAGDRRSRFEFYMIFSQYFDDLDDETFKRVFGADFLNPDANTHEELLCERALILLKPNCFSDDTKLCGLLKLSCLLDKASTCKVLKDTYKITPNCLYEITSSNIFFESAAQFDLIEEYITFKNLAKVKLKNHPGILRFLKTMYRVIH